MSCACTSCISCHCGNRRQSLVLATIRCIQGALIPPPAHAAAVHAASGACCIRVPACSSWTIINKPHWRRVMQVVVEAFQHRGARRPQQQHLDGPFHLQQGQASTRAHQLDSCLLLRDSGLGPAAYDSSSSVKATSPRAATPKV